MPKNPRSHSPGGPKEPPARGLEKVGGGDPWPKPTSTVIGGSSAPCVVCGVDGVHHGIGDHFNVDHTYQVDWRAAYKDIEEECENLALAAAEYEQRLHAAEAQVERLRAENERLRAQRDNMTAALSRIAFYEGTDLTSLLQTIASNALAALNEDQEP